MAAPSFSSFPDIFSKEQAPSKSKDKPLRKDEKSSRKEDKGKRRSNKPEDEHERKRSKREPAAVTPAAPAARLDPLLAPYCFIDPAPEKQGSSSRVQPRYHRDGAGQIVGASRVFRITRHKDDTRVGISVEVEGQGSHKGRNPDFKLKKLSANRRILRPSGELEDLDHAKAFVELPEDEEDEEDDAADGGEGAKFLTSDLEVRQKIAHLETHLREHPADVAGWLRYSSLHRDGAETSNVDPMADGAEVASRAQAEVTMSILDRAFKAHPCNSASSALQIAYFAAAEQIWSKEKIDERWRGLLAELEVKQGDPSAAMELWTHFVSWAEGRGLALRGVDGVVGLYAQCLERFRHIFTDAQTREENSLYIFLRAGLFLRAAGYVERSTALFQALLEITFFKPSALRVPNAPLSTWFAGVTTAFGEFWDSEAPRIGEVGAKGWSSSASLPPPVAVPPKPEKNTGFDPYAKWLTAEGQASRRMPARSTDDVDGEDPFKVILFSDLEPFLFPIQSPEVRFQLIYAFLTFCGLSAAPPEVPTSAASCVDPHLRWNIASTYGRRQNFWPQGEGRYISENGKAVLDLTPRGVNPFDCPMKSWITSSSTLFPPTGDLYARSWFEDYTILDAHTIDAEFIKRVIDVLKPLDPDPSLAILSLALEGMSSSKTSLKSAKQLLKTDRDNLDIWDAYARIERQRQNVDAARTVYITALKACLPDELISGKAEALWSAWAEMEYADGEKEKCLDVLVKSANITDVNVDMVGQMSSGPIEPVRLLKARKHFAAQTYPLSHHPLQLSLLFALLTGNVTALERVHTQQCDALEEGSADLESSHQTFIRILYLHTQRTPSPASLLRSHLEIAIAAFPNNTLFLSLYLEHESSHKIYGRVHALTRHLARESATNTPGVISHYWSVWAEARLAGFAAFKHRNFAGTERVRAALDRGVNSTSGKQAAGLWALYIEFEAMMKRGEAVKKLCARAVTALAGDKSLYLLPFSGNVRKFFSDRELREWANLMLERGIRIRVPFEEYWNDDDYDDEGFLLPSDEELEDDELAFLQERQALKPY